MHLSGEGRVAQTQELDKARVDIGLSGSYTPLEVVDGIPQDRR
jgi:hypothetical protein